MKARQRTFEICSFKGCGVGGEFCGAAITIAIDKHGLELDVTGFLTDNDGVVYVF